MQPQWTDDRFPNLKWTPGLALAAACLLTFAALTAWVVADGTRALDESVLRWFQDQRSAALDVATMDLTALGGETVLALLTLASAGLLLCLRRFSLAGCLLACIVLGRLLGVALKFWLSRPRPEPIPVLLGSSPHGYPSGHAMMSVIVYTTMALLLAPLIPTRTGRIYFFTLMLLLAIGIGVTRLYLGVHYLSDVVAGWLIGLCWVTLFWTGLAAWVRRHQDH